LKRWKEGTERGKARRKKVQNEIFIKGKGGGLMTEERLLELHFGRTVKVAKETKDIAREGGKKKFCKMVEIQKTERASKDNKQQRRGLRKKGGRLYFPFRQGKIKIKRNWHWEKGNIARAKNSGGPKLNCSGTRSYPKENRRRR